MQMLEILQELPRCDREIGSEQMLLKNITNRLASHRVATNLKLIKKKKKAVSGKLNKMKYACMS